MSGCKARHSIRWNDFKKCNSPVHKDGFCSLCFNKDERAYVGPLKKSNGDFPWDARWKRLGIYEEPYDFPYHTTKQEKLWVKNIYNLHPEIKPKEEHYDDYDYEQKQQAVTDWLNKYPTKINYKINNLEKK